MSFKPFNSYMNFRHIIYEKWIQHNTTTRNGETVSNSHWKVNKTETSIEAVPTSTNHELGEVHERFHPKKSASFMRPLMVPMTPVKGSSSFKSSLKRGEKPHHKHPWYVEFFQNHSKMVTSSDLKGIHEFESGSKVLRSQKKMKDRFWIVPKTYLHSNDSPRSCNGRDFSEAPTPRDGCP